MGLWLVLSVDCKRSATPKWLKDLIICSYSFSKALFASSFWKWELPPVCAYATFGLLAGASFCFGMLAPNLFAIFGMVVLHGYAIAIDHPFKLGTYALFAVLCGAASYIAVPAVQRLAIPEASPTLPLAASLGLTFTWNVTLGIPIYIEVARRITTVIPIT